MSTELLKIAEDSARGGFFLISGSILATVISAVATIVVARLLGPELYGQYALALVIPTLLFLVADVGINQGIIKFSASLRVQNQTGRITQIIKYGILFKVLTGTAIFIVCFVFSDSFATIMLNRPDIGPYLRIASLSIIFQIIVTTVTSAFVGLDKTEYNALATSLQATAKSIISLMLVLLGFGVAGAIIGYTVGYIVAAILGTSILILLLRKHSRTEDNGSFAGELKILMSYGIPVYISSLLAGFFLSYQNLILAMFTTDGEIGNFKAAANFITLIAVLAIPITTALLPAFSKLDSAAKEKTRAFFKTANKYTALMILPTAVVMITLSEQMVQIVYGSTYRSAHLFLAIYCLLYFLVGIGYLNLTSLFNGLGETRATLKTNLANVSTFVLLAPLLTSLYRVPGSILAFLVSYSIGVLYGYYIARTKFEIELATRSLIKIYLVSLASSLPALLLLQLPSTPKLLNVLVAGIAYLFTYATLTPLTKIITNPELETVSGILKRIKPLYYVIKPLVEYQKKVLNYVESAPQSRG